MNISKFTQKSVQAVQDLEKVAYEYGNQEIEQEHLLYTLLTQEDSLILKLIEKMEINRDYFIDTVKKALDAKVKVSGGELRFGQYLNKALVNAEDEAKAMGDEYVSVEHLFLALLKYPSPSMKKIWSEFGITKALAKAIQKQVARCTLLSFEPFKSFITKLFGNIQSAKLTAFRIEIKVTRFNVFNLNTNQLAHSCTGSTKIPYNKIPLHDTVLF